MKNLLYLFLFVTVSCFFACEQDVPPPVIISVDPVVAAAGDLVTIEGSDLANIRSITFSGQVVNFNTAFNADNALLMRVPTNVPTGDHLVELTTDGGTASFDFKVTLDPPAIFSFTPEAGLPGDVVTVYGKNFFEPLQVYFHDSIAAEILVHSPDSVMVQVPEGIEKGRIVLWANGGRAESPVDFFSENVILVNDFDGNGVRSETSRWLFTGFTNENAQTAVQNGAPGPLEGNFLKLTGTDDLDISWIGGPETDWGFPGDDFVTFDIRTGANNTFLEMDVNNNGRDNTNVLFILLEHEGAVGDFVEEIKLDDAAGWQHLSIPLTRFFNIENQVVDPTKVRTLKIHLIDADNSGELLEVNVDNIAFKEVL